MVSTPLLYHLYALNPVICSRLNNKSKWFSSKLRKQNEFCRKKQLVHLEEAAKREQIV